MQTAKPLYFASRDQWRNWLARNHTKKEEIWLTYYSKSSGKTGISYDESVEEAICFGWIDSRVKGVDGEKFIRRFGPRQSSEAWSKFNIARARKMLEQEKMTKAGLAVLPSRLRRIGGRTRESKVG